MRERAAAKAGRYLTEGRLILTAVTANTVSALARGDGRIYEISGHGNVWSCTCPARSLNCSHLLAVRRVVAINVGELLVEGHP